MQFNRRFDTSYRQQKDHTIPSHHYGDQTYYTIPSPWRSHYTIPSPWRSHQIIPSRKQFILTHIHPNKRMKNNKIGKIFTVLPIFFKIVHLDTIHLIIPNKIINIHKIGLSCSYCCNDMRIINHLNHCL
jgi:hypothetical protein